MSKRLPKMLGLACGPVLLATILLLPRICQATVMLRLDDSSLAARSHQIVLGDVVRQRVVDVQGELWTETLLRVRQSYKGGAQPGAVLAVRQLGGVLGKRGMRVAGVATFARGERTLVYLRRVGSSYVVVGMAQGKYRVYRDSKGTWRTDRDLSGIAFAQRSPQGRTLIVPPVRLVGAPPRSLSQRVAAIRKVVAAKGRPAIRVVEPKGATR